MAYEKYTWVDGEVITAQKLNHLEGGVEQANSVFVVHINYDEQTDTYSTEESWNDIKNAFLAFVPMVAVYGNQLIPYTSSTVSGDEVEAIVFSQVSSSLKSEGTIDIHNTFIGIAPSEVGYIHEVHTVNVD